MKKRIDFISILLVLLITVTVAWAADLKISQMTEDSAPTGDDLIVTVNDPSGTPANRKVPIYNLGGAIIFWDTAGGSGQDCLDNYPTEKISDNEPAIVIDVTNKTFLPYIYNQAGSCGTENDPYVIVPDDCAGAGGSYKGQWELIESWTFAPVSEPKLIFRDAEATDFDDNIVIGGNATTVTSGAEVLDWYIQSQHAGTARNQVEWDGSAETLTLGDENDGEDLTFDFSASVANEVTVGTNSSASNIHAPNIEITSGVYTITVTGNCTVGTDCDGTKTNVLWGGIIYVTSAAEIELPAIADGMAFSVITVGTIAVSVDPNASDKIVLDGATTLGDGDKATNTSTTGDSIVCTYYSADGWYCMSGSPDGDNWSDGGP